MTPDMKRLCEVALTAAYSADCDGFQCSRSDEPKAAEAIVRAVLMELLEGDDDEIMINRIDRILSESAEA